MAAPAALKGAFDAKVGKVPVIAIGVPIVVIAVVASRMTSKKTASADTSQPTFFAKDVPDTWAAVDTQTGIAHSSDGSITYIPTDGTDPTTPSSVDGPTPAPTPTPVPAPAPPGKLSAHQQHLAHTTHIQHLASQGSNRSTPTHVLNPSSPVSPPPVVAGTPTKSAHQLHEAHVAHVNHVAKK